MSGSIIKNRDSARALRARAKIQIAQEKTPPDERRRKEGTLIKIPGKRKDGKEGNSRKAKRPNPRENKKGDQESTRFQTVEDTRNNSWIRA